MRKNLRPEDTGALLTQPRCATLATRFKNGTVLMSPIWHEWSDGGFSVLVAQDDIKLRHIRRAPNVSISVAEDAPPYRGVEVRAEAVIVSDAAQAVTETLRRIAVRYLGEERGRALCQEWSQIELVLIRITPGTLRVWDFADEPTLAG